MAPWLAVLEAYAVQALLRTPGFHRAVEKVAKNVHRIRHGLPSEEQGDTSIDRPGESGFSQHFIDEIKTQLGRAERSEQNSTILREAEKVMKKEELDESAEAAWREMQKKSAEPPKQGFMEEYMDALRNQIRNGKPPR